MATGARVTLPIQRYDLALPDGGFDEHHWRLSSTPLVDASGRTIAILHEVENVTGAVFTRREQARLEAESREMSEASESQLRTLANAIPTLAWTARADGYIDWYNARWYQYTGATPAAMEGWG